MSEKPIRFEGQVALVTGAGKGIGRAHAERLAERGAAVLVNNRRHAEDPGPGSAEEVASAIRAAGGQAEADGEHVEQPGAGQRMVEHAVDRFGGLDILICNAGASHLKIFHRMSMAEIRELIEINLMGTLDVIRAALDVMRPARRGTILVTNSASALYGDVGFVAYAAAKAALLGLVPSLAAESTRAGIRINAIAPFVHTQMTEWIFEGGHYPREVAEQLRPDLTANLALWLVSRDCPLSGETLVVGGRVIARTQMFTSPGIELEAGEMSPEAVALRYAELADMSKAKSYSQGGELHRAIVERTTGVSITTDSDG